jgi:RIO kinase 1
LSSNRLRNDMDYFEKRFDPLNSDRKARRKRNPKPLHRAGPRDSERIDDIADTIGVEGGLRITYQPSRYESTWLLAALEGFFDQDLIMDVLALVKGGKEASVYCCTPSPSMPADLIAAKVYRPRMFRQLRNDSMYKEGRQVLTGDGRPAKPNDHRLMRAIGKKTEFGAQVAHQSWLLHEFITLKTLHAAGANVPEPYAVGDNAILMGYVGAEGLPAQALNDVRLDRDEAETLFAVALRNIELMLQHDMIHGDLSAYNILYWEGEITLIDFPQVTNVLVNSNAWPILERDVQRVCDYFARQGVDSHPRRIAQQLWETYAVPRRIEPEPEEDEGEQ